MSHAVFAADVAGSASEAESFEAASRSLAKSSYLRVKACSYFTALRAA
jgi:hypothetical protein